MDNVTAMVIFGAVLLIGIFGLIFCFVYVIKAVSDMYKIKEHTEEDIRYRQGYTKGHAEGMTQGYDHGYRDAVLDIENKK